MYNKYSLYAPVVKRISCLPSKQTFQVRFLAGAQINDLKVFEALICASRSAMAQGGVARFFSRKILVTTQILNLNVLLIQY